MLKKCIQTKLGYTQIIQIHTHTQTSKITCDKHYPNEFQR